jgi:hypothetical protein
MHSGATHQVLLWHMRPPGCVFVRPAFEKGLRGMLQLEHQVLSTAWPAGLPAAYRGCQWSGLAVQCASSGQAAGHAIWLGHMHDCHDNGDKYTN